MTLLRWVFAHGNAKRLKCPTCLQVSLVWRAKAANKLCCVAVSLE
jgi:hypothetical protein